MIIHMIRIHFKNLEIMNHIAYLIALVITGTIFSTLYVVGYKIGNSPVNGLKLKNYYLEQKKDSLKRENEMLKLHIIELKKSGGKSYKC